MVSMSSYSILPTHPADDVGPAAVVTPTVSVADSSHGRLTTHTKIAMVVVTGEHIEFIL